MEVAVGPAVVVLAEDVVVAAVVDAGVGDSVAAGVVFFQAATAVVDRVDVVVLLVTGVDAVHVPGVVTLAAVVAAVVAVVVDAKVAGPTVVANEADLAFAAFADARTCYGQPEAKHNLRLCKQKFQK